MHSKPSRFEVLPLFLALIVAASPLAACQDPERFARLDAEGNGDAITIGLVAPMTGPAALAGLQLKHGAELAIEEQNEQGGIRGHLIELAVGDSRGDTSEAGVAALRLIDLDGAVALVGEYSSAVTKGVAMRASPLGIPVVAPIATHPSITRIGPNVFRAGFVDDFQGEVIARFAREKLGLSRMAILKEIESDFSIAVSQRFKEVFESLGGRIEIIQSCSNRDSDLSAQITAIRARGVDGLFAPTSPTLGALIAVTAKRLDLQVPLVSGDGWDSPEFYNIGGDAVHGSHVVNHYVADPAQGSAKQKAFIDRYRKKHGELPSANAALSYDSTALILRAMRTGGSFHPSKIRDALAATQGFDGVTGSMTFDSERNPRKSALVVENTPQGQRVRATVAPK